MTLWIDRKYVNMLSGRLERFAWKKNDLANFRCPICGDSQKNKLKARGYVFPRKGNMYFKCHNCNAGLTLGNLIKQIDQTLYNEYLKENYREQGGKAADVAEKNILVSAKPIFKVAINLHSIADLPIDHRARLYVSMRKIPREFFSQIYYAVDFKKFIDESFPDHGKTLLAYEERIVIPFYDKNKNLLAVQGRALNPKAKIRYITIKQNPESVKLYGLDRHNYSDHTYVVEGPFDSLFLPNALAAAGASLDDTLRFVDSDTTTFVYDNEPRNADIVKQMEKIVDKGLNIFIWPDNIQQKDINDVILSGMTPAELRGVIDSNTFKGLEAKFRLSSWKKC